MAGAPRMTARSRAACPAGGYALPIDEVKTAARALTNIKMYLRAWLGADLREEARLDQKPDDSIQVIRTVYVETVHAGSPALSAGLRAGDQFVSMNGLPVRRMAEVRTAVLRLKPGESLRFTLRRDGKETTAVVPFSMRGR
jgi:serine protease Do